MRSLLRDAALILGASVALVLLFVVLRRLGLPFGLRVVPMAEDYNWLLILSAPDVPARAQAFWSMNDRNPLSPWWYILARPIYAELPNGPYLVRLAISPLLALAAYLAVRAVAPGRNRALALSVGLVAAVWGFSSYLDQITWNFLGALSLSLLCVAAFALWLHSGRSLPWLYGLSICLWFGAFGTYTFQAGAILAVGLLSLASQLAGRVGLLRAAWRAALEVLPFAIIFALFLLVWTTTRNPTFSAYYELRPDLLLANLPDSLAAGLWPSRYTGFLPPAIQALGGWLAPICGVAGVLAALAVRTAMKGTDPDPAGAAIALAVGACLVLPTALIESMSATWSIGTRWVMLDQAWQPLLWLGLGAAAAAFLPAPRLVLPAMAGTGAALAVALSLGHNLLAGATSVNEAALRRGVTELVAAQGARPVHAIILVAEGVPVNFHDVMSGRIGSVWLPGTGSTMRILRPGATPAEAEHAAWWRVILGEEQVANIAIGGGAAPYDRVVFARFDGRDVRPLDRVTAADVEGYPAAWRRSAPVEQRRQDPPGR